MLLGVFYAHQTPSYRDNFDSVTNVSIDDIPVPAASNPTHNVRDELAGQGVKKSGSGFDQLVSMPVDFAMTIQGLRRGRWRWAAGCSSGETESNRRDG